MKAVKVIIGMFALALFTFACQEKKTETEVIEKTTVIEKKAEKTPEEEDGTSLSIGKDGVEFSTKTGDKKTEVKVKEDGAAVEVEK